MHFLEDTRTKLFCQPRDIVVVMIFAGGDRSAFSFISCVQLRVLKKFVIVAQNREL